MRSLVLSIESLAFLSEYTDYENSVKIARFFPITANSYHWGSIAEVSENVILLESLFVELTFESCLFHFDREIGQLLI